MGEILQRLKDEARWRSPGDRLELVEDLLGNPEDFGGPFAADWASEAEDRLAAFRLGSDARRHGPSPPFVTIRFLRVA